MSLIRISTWTSEKEKEMMVKTAKEMKLSLSAFVRFLYTNYLNNAAIDKNKQK